MRKIDPSVVFDTESLATTLGISREAVDKAYTRYQEKIGGKQPGELLIIEPTRAEKEARKKARRDRVIAVEQLRPWLHADHEY